MFKALHELTLIWGKDQNFVMFQSRVLLSACYGMLSNSLKHENMDPFGCFFCHVCFAKAEILIKSKYLKMYLTKLSGFPAEYVLKVNIKVR